ncbi:MAG: glycoside hydrolase family 172 protein [Flavitalea sp.]
MKTIFTLLLLLAMINISAQELFQFKNNTTPGWSSFENKNSIKSAGGTSNRNAKGHAFEDLAPGSVTELLNIKGAGTIQRIWMTVSDRSQFMLRSMKLEFYWDDEKTPAVSVPLGDFFGHALGKMSAFENELFSSPEGRSFNSIVPMPFRKAAKVLLVNESDRKQTLFYEIDFIKVKQHPSMTLYFHAFYNDNAGTKLGEDYTLLPALNGRGRFLGTHMGIITDSLYSTSWWGEGEVKIYIDDDGENPTLVGTGTEDYIGTGWGQGKYINRYQGCWLADSKTREWSFYRYHIPDELYFNKNIRVTIQQMGGESTDFVRKIVANGAKLLPVTVSTEKGFVKLFELNQAIALSNENFPQGWTNFYRLDNYSAVSYFYYDKPSSALPAISSKENRLRGISK